LESAKKVRELKITAKRRILKLLSKKKKPIEQRNLLGLRLKKRKKRKPPQIVNVGGQSTRLNEGQLLLLKRLLMMPPFGREFVKRMPPEKRKLVKMLPKKRKLVKMLQRKLLMLLPKKRKLLKMQILQNLQESLPPPPKPRKKKAVI